MGKNTSATNYPFKACTKGHSLEGDDAFIIVQGGNRVCRMCVRETQAKSQKQKPERSTIGAFDG